MRYVRTLSPLAEAAADSFRYRLAHAAAWDAGSASMRAAGRTAWNADDWNAMCAEFDRLLPVVPTPPPCAVENPPAR